MSSTHLTPDLVSDLVEGLLDAAGEAEAERHLAGCAECQDLRDGLVDVRLMLGGLGSPVMPTPVVESLDAALARARVHDADADFDDTADAHEATPDATDVVPLTSYRGPRPRRRDLQWLGAAAAGLAVVFGGITVLGGDGSGGDQAGSTRVESAGKGAGDLADDRGQVAVTASGRAYDAASLPGAVDMLLATPSPDAQPEAAAPRIESQTEPDRRPTTGAESPGASSPALADPRALRSCLSALHPSDARPLAVDVGTFTGHPASVIVLPSAAEPGMVEVYVVSPSCSAKRPGVRYHTRVAGP